jgi:hypothetical protein
MPSIENGLAADTRELAREVEDLDQAAGDSGA